MSKIFCFAANGPIWGEFRSENAHVALTCPRLVGIHSPDVVGMYHAFRASFTPNRPHFRLKQKYLNKLLNVCFNGQVEVWIILLSCQGYHQKHQR